MPHTRISRLRLFLPLAVPFAILVAVAAFGALSRQSPALTAPPGVRGSLVWGDGIFARPADLKAWLHLHGASYDAWAKQHPAGMQLIRPQIFLPPVNLRHRAKKANHVASKP